MTYLCAGGPNITEFKFDRESRTFTCTSTGGPATNVTWRRDGLLITHNATHQQTKMVVDATRGIYQNILTIAQSVAEHNVYGLYSCMVENSLGISNRTEKYSGESNELAIMQVLLALN